MAGMKTWVPGEEVIAADMNGFLQTQVVPQFTTTAQRDAQWPSPPDGAMCVTVDTGTTWQRRAGVWVGGPTALTLATPNVVAPEAGLSVLTIYQVGRVVYLSGGAKLTIATTNMQALALLATPMPAGVRPTAQISGFAHYSAGTTPAGATVVNVAGDVVTYGPAQAANSYVFIDMFWIR